MGFTPLPSAIEKPPRSGRLHGMASKQEQVSASGALERLDGADRDFAGTAVFLRVEGDLLTFAETANAGALQSGGVDEHVLAAIIRRDEAETLLTIVELYGARNHADVLSVTLSAREPRPRDARSDARFVDVWRV